MPTGKQQHGRVKRPDAGDHTIGPRGYVAERLAAFAEAGVTTLLLAPVAADREESVRFFEEALRLQPG